MFARKMAPPVPEQELKIPEAKKDVPKPIARIVNFLASLHFEKNYLMPPDEGLSTKDKKVLFEIDKLLRSADSKSANKILGECLHLAKGLHWDPIRDELILRLHNPFVNIDQPTENSPTPAESPSKVSAESPPKEVPDKFFKPRLIHVFETVDASYFTVKERRIYKSLYALLSSPWPRTEQEKKKAEFEEHVKTVFLNTDTKTAAFQNFIDNVKKNLTAPATVPLQETLDEKKLNDTLSLLPPPGEVPENLPLAWSPDILEPATHSITSLTDLIDLLRRFESNYFDSLPQPPRNLEREEKNLILQILDTLRNIGPTNPLFAVEEAQKIIRSTPTKKDFERVKTKLLQELSEVSHHLQEIYSPRPLERVCETTDTTLFSPLEKRRFGIIENIIKSITPSNFDQRRKEIEYYLTTFSHDQKTQSNAFGEFLKNIHQVLSPQKEPVVQTEQHSLAPISPAVHSQTEPLPHVTLVPPPEEIPALPLTPAPPEAEEPPAHPFPFVSRVGSPDEEAVPPEDIFGTPHPDAPLGLPSVAADTQQEAGAPEDNQPSASLHDSVERGPMSDDSLQGLLNAAQALDFQPPAPPPVAPSRDYSKMSKEELQALAEAEFGRIDEGWDDFDEPEVHAAAKREEVKDKLHENKQTQHFETPNGSKATYFGRLDAHGQRHNHGKIEVLGKNSESGDEILKYVPDRAHIDVIKPILKDHTLMVRGTSHYTVEAEFVHGEIISPVTVEYLNEHGQNIVVEGGVDENFLPDGENCNARLDAKDLVFHGSFQNGKPFFGRTYKKQNIEQNGGAFHGKEEVELTPLYQTEHYVDPDFYPTDEKGVLLIAKVVDPDPERATREFIPLRDLHPDLSPFEDGPGDGGLTIFHGEFPDLLASSEAQPSDTDKIPEIDSLDSLDTQSTLNALTPPERTFSSVEKEIEQNFALTAEDFANNREMQALEMLRYYEDIQLYINQAGREHFSPEFLNFLESVYTKYAPQEAESLPAQPSITQTQEFSFGMDRKTIPLAPIPYEPHMVEHRILREPFLGIRTDLHHAFTDELRTHHNELGTERYTEEEIHLIERALHILESDKKTEEAKTVRIIQNIFRNFDEPVTSVLFSHLQAKILGMAELFEEQIFEAAPTQKIIKREPAKSAEEDSFVKRLRTQVNTMSHEIITASLESRHHLHTAERRALGTLSGHMRKAHNLPDFLSTLSEFLTATKDFASPTEFFNTFREQIDYLFSTWKKRTSPQETDQTSNLSSPEAPAQKPEVQPSPQPLVRVEKTPTVVQVSNFEKRFAPVREYFVLTVASVPPQEKASMVKMLGDIKTQMQNGEPDIHVFQENIFEAQRPGETLSHNFIEGMKKIDATFFDSQNTHIIDAFERTKKAQSRSEGRTFQAELRTQVLKVLSDEEYALLPADLFKNLFEDKHLRIEDAVKNERVKLEHALNDQRISIREINALQKAKPDGLLSRLLGAVGLNTAYTQREALKKNTLVKQWLALEKLLQQSNKIKKP